MIKQLINKYNTMNKPMKASLWFAFCSFFQKGISTITLPIFTRLMNTSEYGEYSVFQAWYNILILVVTFNIQSEIFNKGLIDNSSKKDDYTSNQVGLLIVLSSLFVVIFIIFNKLFVKLFDIKMILIIIMLLEILANSIITIWASRKKFDYDYKKIVLVTLAMSIINPIIGIIAVYFSSDKANARIISNAIVPIIFSVVILVYIRKKGKLFSNITWWKKALFLSLPLMPHYLSLVLLNQSDKLMINYYINSSSSAIYSVAHSAGLLLTIINTSINSSFVPWIYSKLKDNNLSKICNVTNMLMLIVLLANILLMWFTPELIKILADKSYHNAIWCLPPISASVFFFFIYTIAVDVEIYYEKNHYVASASCIAAILNLILNYIFIPKYGMYAAGYTTLFSYFVTMLLHFIFLNKILKTKKSNLILFNNKYLVIYSIILLLFMFGSIVLYKKRFIAYIISIVLFLIILTFRKKIISTLNIIKKERG